MRITKKLGVFILAIAMTFTMTTGFAFSDVPARSNYSEAVSVLSGLGIVNGVSDTRFNPKGLITRAEAATMLVRVKNMEPVPGTPVFADVPADHWAAGYINAAYNAGIINGRSETKFDPDASVKYEEMIKMIVAALGYEPIIKYRGGYPTGYLAIASQEGISTGANGVVGQPATRGMVARLIYNALDVDQMDQTVFGADASYSKIEGTNFLTGLSISKIEGVVSDSYYTADEYNSKSHNVTITAGKNNTEYNGNTYDKNEIIGQFAEGNTSTATMLGWYCVFYIGEDETTGDETILAVVPKTSKSSETIVKSTQFANPDDELTDSELNKVDNGTVYYWKNSKTDRRPATVTPDDNAIVYVNYAEQTDYDESDGAYFYNLLAHDGGIVNFIDNDGDGDFNVALVSLYSKEGVIDSVKRDSDGRYTFKGKTSNSSMPEVYDPEDDEQLKLFIKDEEYITPKDIKEGDTITTIGDEDSNSVIIYQVSSQNIDGKSTSYNNDDDTLTIGGKSYEASPMFSEDLSRYRNTTGTFYLNADGLIAYIDGTVNTSGTYAYVLGVDIYEDWGSTKYEVGLIDSTTGHLRTYYLKNENVATYGFDGHDGIYRASAEEIYDVYNDIIKDAYQNRIIKYTVDNNQITKIVFVNTYDEFEQDSYENKSYNDEDKTIGSSNPFTSDTYIFSVDTTDVDSSNSDFSDPDRITVTKGARFIDENEYSVYTYSENDYVTAAIQLGGESALNRKDVFVVTSYDIDSNEDDENIITFKGYQDGTTTSFKLYDDDDGYADMLANGEMNIAKGSILLVGEQSGSYVDKIDFVLQINRDKNYISKDFIDNTDVYNRTRDNGNDILTDYSDVLVQEDGVYVDNNYIQIAGWEGDRGYRPVSRTNIYVVDFSAPRYTSASIKVSTIDDLDVSPEKYDLQAFFWVYDADNLDSTELYDERSNVTTMVVYKFAAGEAPLREEPFEQTVDYNDVDIIDWSSVD